eukprot:3664054-Amphidinium_carterae.1
MVCQISLPLREVRPVLACTGLVLKRLTPGVVALVVSPKQWVPSTPLGLFRLVWSLWGNALGYTCLIGLSEAQGAMFGVHCGC